MGRLRDRGKAGAAAGMTEGIARVSQKSGAGGQRRPSRNGADRVTDIARVR